MYGSMVCSRDTVMPVICSHVSYYLLFEDISVVFSFRIFIWSVIYIVIFCKDVECDRSFLDSLILVLLNLQL